MSDSEVYVDPQTKINVRCSKVCHDEEADYPSVEWFAYEHGFTLTVPWEGSNPPPEPGDFYEVGFALREKRHRRVS